ncbi:MAG TPA: hypothetical protein VNK41_08945 [Vicinamibacterales bacterium]|nr:hypothetical protein [Vicinamibacterales bacterium]
MRPPFRWLIAAVAALSVWTASGTLTFASIEGPRIGVLPPLWVFALLLGAAMAAARLPGARGSGLPLLASALALLPWLPLPVPRAFLVWTRPLALVVAAAVILAAFFQVLRQRGSRWMPALDDPGRAPRIAALIAVVLYGLAAWRVAPMIPGGDEPHYLIITQSLLYDFDLKIENNHARGDYREYVSIDLRPDYIVRGTDGEIYSIHMPGVSALVAPAFLVGGYPGTVAFVIVLAAIAGALFWRIAYRMTSSAGAAWFAWAAVSLSVPIVFHAFTMYPDGVGVLPVLLGVAALLDASDARAGRAVPISRWILYGAALASLPWLHSRFALLAGGLGLMTLLRLWGAPGFTRSAAALLAVPAVSAVGWFGFFWILYGSPHPRAQYGTLLDAISSPWFVTSGIGGLLFDQQFGLLTHAPAFACGFAGLWIMAVRSRQQATDVPGPRRLAVELLLLVLPYTISTTTMRMWWGGWSAPARFLVVLLPLVGIGAAFAWQTASRRATRAVMLASLGLTAAITATLVWVDRGRLAYDVRQTDALWLEWMGPVADLARGVPTFLRTPEPLAWIQTIVWLAALTAAWLAVRWADGRFVRSRAGIALTLALAGATAGMIALTVVWRLNRSAGVWPVASQLDLLRAVANRSGIGVAFNPLSRIALEHIPPRMEIQPGPRLPQGPQEQVAALPGPVPAGTYEIRVTPAGDQPASPVPPAEGMLSAGIGREFVAIWRTPMAHPTSMEVEFPVDVRAIVLRTEGTKPSSFLTTIRPMAVQPAESLPALGVARQAIRYRHTVVYFMNDGAFPEPNAFWVRGANSADVVLHPEAARQTAPLFIRNAPVPNTFRVEVGRWREELRLAPGEERRIEVPLDRSGATLVRLTSASGFRPSERSPTSSDRRFLGVWVRVE